MDPRHPTIAITRRTAPVSRRTVFRLGGGALLGASLLGRWSRAAGQDATLPAGTPGPFQGDTYVGVADDGLTFVAVVLAAPDAAGQRQTRAYLCDAPRIDLWFTGAGPDAGLDLATDAGATLTAQLIGADVQGTATLPDGSTLGFVATSATGPAGFFALTIDDAGVVRATAADGRATLEGWVLTTTVLLADWQECHPVAAAIVPEAGGPQAILGAVDVRGASDSCRLIVLPDGRSKGAGKTKSGAGFAWWLID